MYYNHWHSRRNTILRTIYHYTKAFFWQLIISFCSRNPQYCTQSQSVEWGWCWWKGAAPLDRHEFRFRVCISYSFCSTIWNNCVAVNEAHGKMKMKHFLCPMGIFSYSKFIGIVISVLTVSSLKYFRLFGSSWNRANEVWQVFINYQGKLS